MLQMSIPVIAAANLDPANERGKQLLDCLGHRSCQALADYGCTELRIAESPEQRLTRCASRTRSLQFPPFGFPNISLQPLR